MGLCPEELRHLVIKPTLEYLNQYSLAAETLLMGTAAVAIAAAAATPGTLLSEVSTASDPAQVTFGHPSGTLDVSAQVSEDHGVFKADLVGMARSARRLMVGEVFVPV